MCGIIGYAGRREAAPVLLEGLANLENRGYDSAGIAVLSSGGSVAVRKASGKLESLVSSLNGSLPEGRVGVGHTRWATHGKASLSNAHPHLDCGDNVIVVHNGIVENYIELREELIAQGHTFASETDSEVLPHLVESFLNNGATPEEAVRRTAKLLKGAQAVAVALKREPERVMAFRVGNAGGIAVGYGDGEMLLASDLPAIIPHTQRVAFLSAGEMVSVTSDGASYSTLDGAELCKSPQVLPYDPVSVAKNGYSHFILKEIQEQPQAAIATLRGRVSFDPWDVELDGINLTDDDLRGIDRVIFVAMGTSYHAAMIGRHMMERLAGIPSEAENASEFRYRDPILDSRTLVVSVGQSGETADTLSAMEEASRKGARLITVCNAEGSGATRMAEGCVYLRCGPEIGVASTKTFTCSLEALYILAAYVGRRRGYLPQEDMGDVLEDLARLPDLLGGLVSRHEEAEALAELYHDRPHFMYLGRGPNYAVAMEGALKLKEMAYVHAEGCPAGEMKHGPIALVDETMPIVAIAPDDGLRDKMLNSIFEVKARGGTVIAVATEGDEEMADVADHVLYIPQLSPLLTCILASVPLQLLAYHIAVKRGCDVDQPRNLAKTVTVE
ncbi:MAG: glutamine--fructose-6-phosphate transaminase (isomerizing) [Chloroflexota bacterium]|nr:glutamine--fructose-6-phosphate transaminase (isomerizing) [Chloroflexota bacterium]MDE2940945.1 glutamine--fructose-6-phosphate transaminase (isomerizing) [Chloroflexota bacterium]MDE3267007.1 glutamine--fructose-6-phosphate transaminase (isomerizing) [Chloroflexota bacterium]